MKYVQNVNINSKKQKKKKKNISKEKELQLIKVHSLENGCKVLKH